MASCPTCRTVIPCHCHLAPPVQTRPGVYLTVDAHARTRAAAPQVLRTHSAGGSEETP